MPIKQIQLRGISRTPSDRATADGGCAESLNVHLDQQETAPTLPPEDITENIYGTAADQKPIVFIHKMLGVTNYIGYADYSFRAYGISLPAGGDDMDSTSVGTGEALQHIASIGNTLIAYTDKKPYYFLFKGGEYTFLGTQIPRPAIEVITRPSDKDSWYDDCEFIPSGLRGADYSSGVDSEYLKMWDDAKDEKDDNHAALLEVMEQCWNTLRLKIDNRRNDGVFVAPFFLRYAVRLYDDSYIYQSTPILCGAGKSLDWAGIYLYHNYYSSGVGGDRNYRGYVLHCCLNNLFKVRIKGSYNVGNWSEIVKSIDFFASTPIYAPAIDAGFNSISKTISSHTLRTTAGYTTINGYDIVFNKMEQGARSQTIKDEVLSKAGFYKIKTIEVSDLAQMGDLASGTMKIEASEDVNGDNLATHDELVDNYRDSIQYVPTNDCFNLNNRILFAGAREFLSRGPMFMNGLMSDHDGSSAGLGGNNGYWSFSLRYKIENAMTGEVAFINANNMNGGDILQPGYIITRDDESTEQYFGNEVAPGQISLWHAASPYSWICYPDSRCTEAEVFFWYNGTNYRGAKKIPMAKHPSLQCAYAFLGMGIALQDIRNNSNYDSGERTDLSEDENLVLNGHNKLFLSNFENPFLFPAGNIITFLDNVVGAAMTSAPLSEGQVGDFDLYVFTEGGIRVLSINSEGTFSGNNVLPTNVSRHVALPGTITPIEQAIIFTTEKGVMLLSGSQVTELSRNMNGRPYSIDEDTEAMIRLSQWASNVDAISGDTTFMAFMREAKAAYDSNDARLIFFNSEYLYQYVYMIDTSTWHKIRFGNSAYRILNSYPECLVSTPRIVTLTITEIPSTPFQAAVANILVNYGVFENESDAMEELYNRPFSCDVSGVQDIDGLNENLSSMPSVEYSIETSSSLGVYKFSTVLDDVDVLSDTENSVKGIIVTRPFDLGEPDVRKAIKSVRIRGRYNRNNVRYILLGSFDGIHWRRLHSLRGGSFKMFRMVILTDLAPTERISWIDIDYESRFANRLR